MTSRRKARSKARQRSRQAVDARTSEPVPQENPESELVPVPFEGVPLARLQQMVERDVYAETVAQTGFDPGA